MGSVRDNGAAVEIDAAGLFQRELNARIKELAFHGTRRVELRNVFGQRYIGTGLSGALDIEIHGVPGNDLGAFMDGPRITVHGNAQDGVANTMNSGQIIVHGRAGDILGLSARGGEVYIQGGAGYRAGIHMKEHQGQRPVIVIGGTAQDFLGEYMAGGLLILLGLSLKEGEAHRARFIGTGMHGGVIYLRGSVSASQLGREVGVAELEAEDRRLLERYVGEFAAIFSYDACRILEGKFTKLFPRWLRPYGRLYAS